MKDQDLLKYSQNIKSDATAMLDQTNLIEILKKFGDVYIGGSFKYDLMWGPDIDMIVICPDTRKSSFAALNQVVESKIAQKYEYGDFVTFKRDKRPESYILNVILPFKNRKWEIEIWFFTEIPDSQKSTDSLIKTQLNDINKLEILRMKEKRETSGLSKHSQSSFEIYQKVLG